MASDDVKVDVSAQTATPEVGRQRPYTVVIVGDLGAAERLPNLTPADKDDFAAVLAKARPTLPLSVKDPIGSGPDWEFQICFESMKTFEPAGLLAQIPAARWRLGVREKVQARQTGQITAAELEAALSSAAAADPGLAWLRHVGEAPPAPASPSPAAPPAPAGANVLDMVDEPDAKSRVAADVERLAAEAGRSEARLSSGEAGRLNAINNRLDRELGAIADAVLKHPDVRRLETAWRSVKRLVDRFDFRAGVRLALLHARRDEAVDRFITHVVNPAFQGDIPTPGLIVFDFAMGNSAADFELLDYLAQHAASLPVPVAYPVDAQFFNVKNLRLMRNLPNLSGLIDGWEFAKWRTLREKPYAKALAPVLGRFILRAPHEPRNGAREFTYKENVSTIGDVVWAGGHVAMALCAARAFAAHGWPTRMFGVEAGKIEDVPVVENPTDAQNPWGPGDLLLPDARLDEPPTVGLNILHAIKGKDYCVLLGGVTAAKPVVTQEVSKNQALLEISLPYQQFSNIVSAYLCEQMPALHGLPANDIQQRLLFGLASLLRVKPDDDPEAIQVGVGAHPDDAARTVVQIRVAPPPRIAPGGLHIEFGFAV
ncbi:MAG: type VI secretion system contractile sheath large subunit [Phycisphaerae bacterium]|jgi:type VI secretion system protein ImpC